MAWLAQAAPVSPLAAAFQEVGRRLVVRHNETTCLTVLDGRETVFIAKEETTHQVRLVTTVGSRLPAFAAASGRVLLADRPEDEVAALYAECELVTPTGRRLEGLDELFRILRAARRRGYAENLDETALGLHCLAVPVGPPGRAAGGDHAVRPDRADERGAQARDAPRPASRRARHRAAPGQWRSAVAAEYPEPGQWPIPVARVYPIKSIK